MFTGTDPNTLDNRQLLLLLVEQQQTIIADLYGKDAHKGKLSEIFHRIRELEAWKGRAVGAWSVVAAMFFTLGAVFFSTMFFRK